MCVCAGRRTANPFGAPESDACSTVVADTDDAKDAASKSSSKPGTTSNSEHASQCGAVDDGKAPGKTHKDDATKAKETLAELQAQEERRAQEEKRALMEADAMMSALAPPRVLQKTVGTAPKNESVNSRLAADNVRQGALPAHEASHTSRSPSKKMAPMMSPFLSEYIPYARKLACATISCDSLLATQGLGFMFYVQHIDCGFSHIVMFDHAFDRHDMVKQSDACHRYTNPCTQQGLDFCSMSCQICSGMSYLCGIHTN